MTKLTSRNPSSEELKVIENKTFGEERALYNSKDVLINNVNFEGTEDGESALKESSNVVVDSCKFALRYPLWHVTSAVIVNSKFLDTCRAPMWYDKDLVIKNSESNAVKILRECKDILVSDSSLISEEPFWNCKQVRIENSTIEGFYAFFGSSNVYLKNVKFTGKYSFQYCSNVFIEDSTLDTKDAFWHTKNVFVKNSTIKGEYLGWYSKNITFKDCVIESHQPLCYAKNIKFINCKMPNSDLAFEYSKVNGNILGKVDSIKNLRKGKIRVDEVDEIINSDSKYKTKGKVITKKGC